MYGVWKKLSVRIIKTLTFFSSLNLPGHLRSTVPLKPLFLAMSTIRYDKKETWSWFSRWRLYLHKLFFTNLHRFEGVGSLLTLTFFTLCTYKTGNMINVDFRGGRSWPWRMLSRTLSWATPRKGFSRCWLFLIKLIRENFCHRYNELYLQLCVRGVRV